MITLTNKLLSKEAAALYYSLYSDIKYVDLITQAVKCRLTPIQTDKAIKELQEQDLIDVKITFRRKRKTN